MTYRPPPWKDLRAEFTAIVRDTSARETELAMYGMAGKSSINRWIRGEATPNRDKRMRIAHLIHKVRESEASQVGQSQKPK